MTNKKTAVIEWLFINKARLNKKTGQLSQSVMTFDDVVEGIEAAGDGLSSRNPANFWKDITRKDPNVYWPAKVSNAGWTGADAIGGGDHACFMFVQIPAGQNTAFPAPRMPSTALQARAHTVQSLSIPMDTKSLGRSDENWLAQVGVRLAVIETHFSVFSKRSAAEVTFLQTGVKLRHGEVDIAYKLVETDATVWLLAVEAKGRNEVIHDPQVLRAAQALNKFKDGIKDSESVIGGVIPMAVKVLGPSTIYVVEYAPISSDSDPLSLASEGVIVLKPSVRGIE